MYLWLQETLERLRERKQDLKQQVSDLQSELDDSKKAHRYVLVVL